MASEKRSDGFQLKWRTFHPQSTVWVANPFEHDVVFNVADEHNNPYTYRMPAGKTSELPGGAIATLGVKAIVDELIQSNSADVFSMWEVGVRSKYEDQIIVRIKEAPNTVTARNGGEVNLVSADDVNADDEDDATAAEELPVFPGRNSAVQEETVYNDEDEIKAASVAASAHASATSIAEASLAGLKGSTELSGE